MSPLNAIVMLFTFSLSTISGEDPLVFTSHTKSGEKISHLVENFELRMSPMPSFLIPSSMNADDLKRMVRSSCGSDRGMLPASVIIHQSFRSRHEPFEKFMSMDREKLCYEMCAVAANLHTDFCQNRQ